MARCSMPGGTFLIVEVGASSADFQDWFVQRLVELAAEARHDGQRFGAFANLRYALPRHREIKVGKSAVFVVRAEQSYGLIP